MEDIVCKLAVEELGLWEESRMGDQGQCPWHEAERKLQLLGDGGAGFGTALDGAQQHDCLVHAQDHVGEVVNLTLRLRTRGGRCVAWAWALRWQEVSLTRELRRHSNAAAHQLRLTLVRVGEMFAPR